MTTDPLPHWDLSTVYPGLESAEFQAAVRQARDRLDALDAYLLAHQIEPGGPVPADPAAVAGILGGYLERMNALRVHSSTLRAYVRSFVTTDSYNTTARRLMSELEPLLVRQERQAVLFRGWIGTLAADGNALEAALAVGGPAGDHAFHVRETAAQSRYMMSVAEETLAAELSLSGATAWQKLHGILTSQLTVPFPLPDPTPAIPDPHPVGAQQVESRRLLGAAPSELPIPVLQNLRTHPDAGTRRRAYEAELAAWRGIEEPLAACLNGVKGAVHTLNERRGRPDALHQALEQARIDRDTLETLLGAMRDAFPSLRRYWQAKARLLGKESLPWWDLQAPVGSLDRRYTFDEARELIVGQFGTFSPRLAALAGRAFDGRWIDAEPRSGKVGGAFCMGLPAVEESRILCNFDGSLDQVFTLAHELGHAYHNDCQRGKTPLQRITPMTLAETASIFNETLLTEAVLAEAGNPGEELAILETVLIGAGQLVVDISSRYLFESEVFRRRAAAELAAADLCAIMLDAQRQTYGQGLDPQALNPYMWAWKPHYSRATLSFYNFPYSFGFLFGLGLYSLYRDQGASFPDAYDALLRDTGEATAADLAARFGIDIRQRGFWEGSLGVIEGWIDRYLSLATTGTPDR